MVESESDRRHFLSRRLFAKLAFFGASAGWTGWSMYLYEPPHTKLRSDYNQAWAKWNKSADQLAETGGVWDKAGLFHGPKLDPNNPATPEYYAAQKEVMSLGEKIKDDEFPIVQAQMYGESFGPIVTLLAGASLLLDNSEKSTDTVEPQSTIQNTAPAPQIF